MVAALNLEQALTLPTVQLYGENRYSGQPKYDSRFVDRYARRILAAGNYFDELDAERAWLARNGNARNDNGQARLPSFRSDAGLPLAFARSLEYIIREPYEALYPELRAADFIPLMTEVSPEALSFTYRILDRTGLAKIINENGSDAPKVDLKAKEFQQPVVTVGVAYDYTILDTMRAARLGIPLESYKARAARLAIEYKIEQLAAVGDANYGLVGLTNAPGIQAVTQVSTGGSWVQQVATIAQATTTQAQVPALVVAQAIVGDVNAMIQAIITATNGVHVPDTMLVTVPIYAALRTTPRSPGFTDDNLLDYIEKMCGLQIECWPQLNAAGAISVGGLKGRVMVYKRDPDILNLVQAMPFTQLPPQPDRMAWEVTCYARTGAVQVRRPLAVAYMDGLG